MGRENAVYIADGIYLLHRILKDASANEDYEKTYLEVYLLDSMDYFNPFLLLHSPKKNKLVSEWTVNLRGEPSLAYFVIDSCSITKRSPMQGGKVQLEVSVRLRYIMNVGQTIEAPWRLPAFNFRMSSAVNEESASRFYPDDGDIIYGKKEDPDGYPLINTAGIMLEGTATYSTSQISFSYCISTETFDLIHNSLWDRVGTINSTQVTVCGLTFPSRTLKLESLSAEYNELQKPGRKLDMLGNETDEVVDRIFPYYRIDASFTSNPRTWNQEILNVGTHVNRNGSIQRIWTWNDAEGHPVWGTYSDYRRAGGVNGEAITEPVALNAAGTDVTGLDADGRMIMTYRYGSLYEPVDFNDSLAFPDERPMKWEYGN